jgi:3',5'-cyclic AMP phosphodiesterase CpdA
MRLFSIIAWSLFTTGWLCACGNTDAPATATHGSVGTDSTAIMVASDLHYFSPSLGHSGAAFEAYLKMDRKMIAQSPGLLKSFLDTVKIHQPKILLLTGDLTKDGERISHQELAAALMEIEALGTKVYVIPGNHDISNPNSRAYVGDSSVTTPSISAQEFARIYSNFGYGEAISTDPNSLSYVAEPVPGTWILALDACRYRENATSPLVSGRFQPGTIKWISTQLANAKSQGKIVIGMVHHAVLEHFTGEKTNPISADYVLDGYDTLSRHFAKAGLRVVFTGHVHASDITSNTWGTDTLIDIETGSLVSAPSSFRYGSISNGTLNIQTGRICEVPVGTIGITGDFQTWAKQDLVDGMASLVKNTLVNDYSLDTASAAIISPIAANAYAAHYAGDEVMPANVASIVAYLKSLPDPYKQYFGSTIEALYTDLAPMDDHGRFSLR